MPPVRPPVPRSPRHSPKPTSLQGLWCSHEPISLLGRQRHVGGSGILIGPRAPPPPPGLRLVTALPTHCSGGEAEVREGLRSPAQSTPVLTQWKTERFSKDRRGSGVGPETRDAETPALSRRAGGTPRPATRPGLLSWPHSRYLLHHPPLEREGAEATASWSCFPSAHHPTPQRVPPASTP